MKLKKVTVFGGGTGSFITLSGLKSYSIDLASIVNMMDSGGSTGRLRDQLEVLPQGIFDNVWWHYLRLQFFGENFFYIALTKAISMVIILEIFYYLL
ncbi:hypothetical protein COS12_02180 [Candidatus Roizmanbacteria bacterium CG01_land_8_20_14_3_00_33_9]|uniref:YvcK family protein n=1 Tax=Candidatus Roizmanbacteria bacterium CG01_land_8_20_14_3_00_33_9 TaxID=1974843 RepID=A0A2M7E440_9BACT|nr:MAG: hypothetical protein COS12_02180 [Candidatus Roizmanbacteria bacterium CG01_land_8_20_14_3_00_33_9]